MPLYLSNAVNSSPPITSLHVFSRTAPTARSLDSTDQRNAALLPRLPTANATHPPINATPPNGVIGPMTLKRWGSSTSM